MRSRGNGSPGAAGHTFGCAAAEFNCYAPENDCGEAFSRARTSRNRQRSIPSAVSPKYSGESAGKARMHTCLDQYRANKASVATVL
jgi:hypothetical protein